MLILGEPHKALKQVCYYCCPFLVLVRSFPRDHIPIPKSGLTQRRSRRREALRHGWRRTSRLCKVAISNFVAFITTPRFTHPFVTLIESYRATMKAGRAVVTNDVSSNGQTSLVSRSQSTRWETDSRRTRGISFYEPEQIVPVDKHEIRLLLTGPQSALDKRSSIYADTRTVFTFSIFSFPATALLPCAGGVIV